MARSENIKIALELTEKNFAQLARYIALFEKYHVNGKSIPPTAVKKAFDLLTDERSVQEQIVKSLIKDIVEPLIKKVSVKPYEFSYRSKSGYLNLRTMIETCLTQLSYNYYNVINDANRNYRKEELSYHIYSLFYKYKMNFLNKKYQENVSDYLLYAITGYVLIELGYLPKLVKPSIYNLYHSVDKTLNKVIKKRGIPIISEDNGDDIPN